MTPGERAFELIVGFRASQVLHAAVELRIVDMLADGPLSAEELSAPTRVEASRLRRLMRALAALGVLSETQDGRYSITEVGELFREGVPGSRRALVRMLIPEGYRSWDYFMESLRTGANGHRLAHGMTQWEHMARDADYAARFNDAMAGNSEGVGKFVAESGDFTQAAVVVDVGGGKGSLVSELLLARRSLRGIVVDLAAGLAQTAPYLASQGLSARCEVVEGDFFESVPAGDVHLLKDILHDWDDARATQILRVCRAALKPGGRLMVVERVMPSHVTANPSHWSATASDLHMMVLFDARERTLEEFEEIFGAAGFKLDRFTPGTGAYHLVEAVAV